MHDEQSAYEDGRGLRREIVAALEREGGHYGGALSVVDILATLYASVLHHDPKNPTAPLRDRLVFSKGHAAIAYYAVLKKHGYIDHDLARYAEHSGPLAGHPDATLLRGVDFSSGSLGQGLSAALGMALALRGTRARAWCVLGDGECQEGQVWETAMLADRYAIDNLHAVVDMNGHQEWGLAGREPLPRAADKWRAFGWSTFECDGHDQRALEQVFAAMVATKGRPSVLLAKTIKGKGYPLIESNPRRYHCAKLSPEELGQLDSEHS